jgi:hypothetical protein
MYHYQIVCCMWRKYQQLFSNSQQSPNAFKMDKSYNFVVIIKKLNQTFHCEMALVKGRFFEVSRINTKV